MCIYAYVSLCISLYIYVYIGTFFICICTRICTYMCPSSFIHKEVSIHGPGLVHHAIRQGRILRLSRTKFCFLKWLTVETCSGPSERRELTIPCTYLSVTLIHVVLANSMCVSTGVCVGVFRPRCAKRSQCGHSAVTVRSQCGHSAVYSAVLVFAGISANPSIQEHCSFSIQKLLNGGNTRKCYKN